MAARSLKNGSIALTDNTNTITLAVEEGDFSYTERKPHNMITDRGVLDHWRVGNEEPIEFSFSVKFAGFAAGNVTSGAVSLYEAITQTGGASGWTSTQSAVSDAYTLDMDVTLADPVSGGTDDVLDFQDCVFEEIAFSEGDEYDTLTVSGRALAVRPAIT